MSKTRPTSGYVNACRFSPSEPLVSLFVIYKDTIEKLYSETCGVDGERGDRSIDTIEQFG